VKKSIQSVNLKLVSDFVKYITWHHFLFTTDYVIYC